MDAAQALNALKMTDAEIADAVGVSERTVREWRRGGGVRGRARKELARLCRQRAMGLMVEATNLED